MRRPVLFGLIASVFLAGGCAGQRQAQELNQLKSDIGMLDQRLGQLERAGLRSSTSAWPSDPSIQPAAVEPAAPAPRRTAPAPAPSVKPSKRDIQQALKHAGFYQGSLDGTIGPMTREAIRQFQQVNGLKVDGIVGRQTWDKLSAYVDQSVSAGELSAADPLK